MRAKLWVAGNARVGVPSAINASYSMSTLKREQHTKNKNIFILGLRATPALDTFLEALAFMVDRQSTPSITVIIPSYNPVPELFVRLYNSLIHQSITDFEVILVDDASTRDTAYNCIADSRFRILRQDHNQGPAACRNWGAAEASSPCIFFTDTDCELAPDTLFQAIACLEQDPIVVGNTITQVTTRLGRAIALLGFPGGGIIGFDRVWRVDKANYTNSFSSCNLAFRKDVFEALGRFDQSFPVPGGEDTVLAYYATQQGFAIRYVPDMTIYHVEKSSYMDFVQWQLTRGRGNYHIRRRVPRIGGYLRLRAWTFKNSLLAAGPLYGPLVLFLIVASVYYQLKGMYLESKHHTGAEAS